MSWLARLFRRRELERELDAELRFHFDEHTREARDAGLSRRAAEREARLALGGIEQVKEGARDVRGTRWLEDWWQDTRYTLRAFANEPSFTAVAVLTLGLGLGSAIAVFSAVYPVLFEPLAYPEPERLVSITDRANDGTPVPITFGSYRELQERTLALEGLAVFRPYQPTLTGDNEPERLDGQRVSADYFRTLGVTPALGPGFDPADDRVGGPAVVILSDGLWRRRFAGDPELVGREVRLDGESMTVAGVMPAGFENVPAPNAQIWSLLQYDRSLPSFQSREWGHHLGMIGRIGAGVEAEAALTDLDAITSDPRPDFQRPPWASMEQGLAVRPLREAATASARPVLLTLLGAVMLLLGIACVNVANLILARGERRRGEMAMRAALGARRGRLVRQLLTEGFVLAGLGGVLGLVLARFGIAGLVALSPPGLPRVDAIGLDGAAFGFALGVTTFIALAAGLAPALGGAASGRGGETLEAGRRGGGGHLTTRRILVVAEVALALVLLVGAGLMLRSLQHLFAIAPGFDGTGAVVLQVQVTGRGYADDEAMHRFFTEALDSARAVAGVASAAWTSQLPLSGDNDVYGVLFDDGAMEGSDGGVYRYAVTPGYFEAMRIPLVRGRLLEPGDNAAAPPVVVINESLARRAFLADDALGGRIHVGRADLPWFTVVGVVADVKQASLAAEQADAAYLAPEQWYFADTVRWLVVRTDGDPLALVPSLERAIWSVDPDQPIVRTESLASLIVRSEAQRRFALIVLEAFAALALVLAAVGLYGALSGRVAERLHEIGVRAALGATRERIVALIVRQGMTLTALGAAIGLAAAALLSSALSALLFGVSRLDPVTYLAVTLALVLVSALACWAPAARAARVDPARTLRGG